MADNIKYRFIQNVGDYFPSGYFSDDFLEKVQKCAGISNDELKALGTPFVGLQHDYDEYKNFIINQNPRVEDAIKKTHDFNTRLLKILGYDPSHPYEEPCIVNEDTDPVEMIPVRHILREGNQVKLFIMEMQNLISVDDSEPAGLFEQQYESDPDRTTHQQKYYDGQWRFVFQLDKTKYKISPAIINKAITQIFLLPEERRPHFILMMAGNEVFLFDKDKWSKGSYLEFSLDELFAQARIPAFRNYYGLFHMLVSKQTLAAEGDVVLMDSIIEESYKNAYEVTKDLREGVVLAVETLANEALYYMKNVAHKPFGKYNKETGTYDETDDAFESDVKDDCLTIVYRLLFLFYAESRDELDILPTHDEVYEKGYSLESLRDLEMVRLNSQESRDGYFFDESMHHLFDLLSKGQPASKKGFSVRPIDSPLFDDTKLKVLQGVRIRNVKWQEIIRALSLSRKKNYCGRISYANLGVNQLGSVYESLLAYRGFYAEQDYIEVHKANDEKDGTFLVPYSRMADFDIATEVKCDPQTGAPVILPKGTFVYRLNGRDRQKSASYYTPEVLTRSTVKYTLKAILDEVRSGKRKSTDLLDLKILEPAMGAAAFQNEVINQLAEAYLQYRQEEKRKEYLQRNDLADDKIKVGSWRIAPDKYRDELQKVKAYIATHNVYGVDLNPTAIELGKLSLWLNVIHKDMETPFFNNRLALGNAVIGAWLKVYNRKDVVGLPGKKGRKDTLLPNPWWEKAPHKVKFLKNKVSRSDSEIYHFLLPDKNMLGVLTIKEQKKAHPHEVMQMNKIKKDWTAPLSGEDFQTLQRISDKIDDLLKKHFDNQRKVEAQTNNKTDLWGVYGQTEMQYDRAENYEQKQQLVDKRYNHDNPYFKLAMVMNYWCSLWFWDYDHASMLPTRREFWSDIEAELDVDDEELERQKRKAIRMYADSAEQPDLFAQQELGAAAKEPAPGERMTENESQAISKSSYNTLTSVQGKVRSFFDDSERFKYAKVLADRYHFFHPMLEFLEVFWLRDGFDIICGNPPWIKLEFDEQGIISERFPEVAIRKTSAPDVRRMRDRLFIESPEVEKLYYSEEVENACDTAFMNAYANYPLLVGQQTNLYKCVLENGLSMLSSIGYMGMLHPESIYDDPKGQPLRKEVYHHLRCHFQYENELNLFTGTNDHGRMKFGENIYGPQRIEIKFASISNVFSPNTIDACFGHDGHGICGGIKDEEGHWNTKAHKDRIVWFEEKELQVLSSAFEDGADWRSVKLTSIHAREIVDVLSKLSATRSHVRDCHYILTEGLHEANAVDDGTMVRETCHVSMDNHEMIYSGPHFFVANPCYKDPRNHCNSNGDYDVINLSSIDSDYVQKTNYKRIISESDFCHLINGFVIGHTKEGEGINDLWIDHYKIAYRKMQNLQGERTLTSCILPAKASHINGAISITFEDLSILVELAGLSSSLLLDFYMKTIAAQNLNRNRINTFPLGISPEFKPSLFVRTLELNCLTKYYADLWRDQWDGAYAMEQWSIDDPRLKPFSSLKEEWSWDTPLRNYFERRQALVEIDVISAMALGLSLKDLEMIYTIQFPVLQQNENDTWYDQKGNIVFTCSKGLTGVGCSRPEWESIRGAASADGMTYDGNGIPYVHTIDPAKSELYGGQQVTYYPPYTRCDRIADYRRAWAFFEKKFNS
jgi:hypothetical protein